MVFPENSHDSKLIDFDLMDKVDQLHPTAYNINLEECHPDAKPSSPRKMIHDRDIT